MLFIDEGEAEVEGASPDGDITITEAIEDNVAVALNRLRIDRDRLVEGLKGDIFTASTLNPDSLGTSMMVSTVSYKIEFPTFLLLSVLVATCASTSFIASVASGSSLPKIPSNLKILTWRNGSVTPVTSCSGEKPAVTRFLRWRTSTGTALRNRTRVSAFWEHISVMSVIPVMRTP
ncbi:hypothetical protein BC937DRAFT_87989 [Endogone sp. FLAS-F59071]|nr:hypothetical protein BC937DRAFT_87989 [Endogone sp. FLAS-F59071]|eukprot:RUS19105.1 hypothetical protein BC937DRAFT_87989 [Endogone sp. FLAS-F59071]